MRIHEEITRGQFNDYVAEWLSAIVAAVEKTLRLADISASDVDAVFLTGGSSTVPAVRSILESRFSNEALVHDSRQFDSVAEGLALSARLRRMTAS